jgi:hypothetical protein
MTSVYPPGDVAPALGGLYSTELGLAIRIAAHILAGAAAAVVEKFNEAEWRLIVRVLHDRHVDPENPSPGPIIARLVERAYSLYGDGVGPGRGSAKQMESLVSNIDELDYLEAWAVLIAGRFYWRHVDQLEEMKDCKWWTLAGRRDFYVRVGEAAKKAPENEES